MAAVLIVPNQTGPLPIKAQFYCPTSGDVVLAVSGSVWSSGTNTPVGVNVYIDGEMVTTCSIFSNGPSTHRTFPTRFVQTQLSIGQHTLTLAASTGETNSDKNDFFDVALLY